MAGPHLYNFHDWSLPPEIPELLGLLGFFSFWNETQKVHHIYERPDATGRMRWKTVHFRGGTTKEWQAFLSSITTTEHLLR